MKKTVSTFSIFLTGLIVFSNQLFAQQDAQPRFPWPDGREAAISLSFDDGRYSQVDTGTKFLNQYNVKVTFYVVPSAVEKRVDGWKNAVKSGHEIGNHSLNHPCSGNFLWARNKALEEYTLDSMRRELLECSRQIKKMLGVQPNVFAYPCGQKFVGRGLNTKSYVPLIAELFQSGRGFMEETPNDPSYADFAQLTGIDMDGKDFEQILPIIETARKNGQWIVLAGHEIGQSGNQTTKFDMLKKLIAYAQDPANKIWIAPVGEIGIYVKSKTK